MSYAEPLSAIMGDVARELLGTPDERMSKDAKGILRFGSHGSIEVNTDEGWFADYEAEVRGGVLKLIEHKAGIADPAAAFSFGLKSTASRSRRTTPRAGSSMTTATKPALCCSRWNAGASA